MGISRGVSAVNCRMKKSREFLKSSTSYQAKGVSTTPKRKFDPDAPYQGISGASRITGLAQGYIRRLCKSGAAPCLRVGQEYKINMGRRGNKPQNLCRALRPDRKAKRDDSVNCRNWRWIACVEGSQFPYPGPGNDSRLAWEFARWRRGHPAC